MKINESELFFLNEATDFFVNPGLVVKGLTFLGKPVEVLHDRLPAKARGMISAATKKAIEKGLVAAINTIGSSAATGQVELSSLERSSASSRFHKGTATLTGAVAGLFGLPALAIELPVTTVLILRGISDQARLFGHDLNDIETRLECLMIFALGSSSTTRDDAIESSYFLARAMQAQLLRQTTDVVAKLSAKEMLEAVNKGSAPVLVKFISQIAQLFEIRVSQKMVAEMMPVIGAVGGGALNYAFSDFYTRTARYHFGIRQLEKKYGTEFVHDLMKKRLVERKLEK